MGKSKHKRHEPEDDIVITVINPNPTPCTICYGPLKPTIDHPLYDMRTRILHFASAPSIRMRPADVMFGEEDILPPGTQIIYPDSWKKINRIINAVCKAKRREERKRRRLKEKERRNRIKKEDNRDGEDQAD